MFNATILEASCNPSARSLPNEAPNNSLQDISNSSKEGELEIKFLICVYRIGEISECDYFQTFGSDG